MGQTLTSSHSQHTSTAAQAAAQALLIGKNRQQKAEKKVLVVGSGCAGLAVAWHLNRVGVDVTLFEKEEKLGGHANTIVVDGVAVDTGFMVYNSLNYPHLCSFFEEVGIRGLPTAMGFSVSVNDGAFEWCSDSLRGLLATPSNIVNPIFYTMMKDIFRFNKEAISLLQLPNDHPHKAITVKDFLALHHLSEAFRDNYLIPMTAAIWSASAADILDFPAFTLFTFLQNHLLLQISEHIDWQTPAKRSVEYVDLIAKELGERAQTNISIRQIERGEQIKVTFTRSDGREEVEEVFDELVLACHPDQALDLLGVSGSGGGVTAEERDALSAFKYSNNDTYVHCDERLMPRSRSAWTSWNYLARSHDPSQKPVFVSYWLNKLQSLNHPRDIFVSLNPSTPPAPEKTFARIDYAHPQYTRDSIRAQKAIQQLQGCNNTFYVGAYLGYGFHEDGFRSGIEVAMMLTGQPVPWMSRLYEHHQRTKTVVSGAIPKPLAALTRPVAGWLERMCQNQVLSFLQGGMAKGKLTLILPDHSVQVLQGEHPGHEVSVKVLDGWFFLRVALEADIGMAKSFINGDWEVVDSPISRVSSTTSAETSSDELEEEECKGKDRVRRHDEYDQLTSFLALLVDNMPHGNSTAVGLGGGWDAKKLLTATIGTALNKIYYSITMDNSLANSQSNIHAHYDLSNDLFSTFLDTETMMYSSAIFKMIPSAAGASQEGRVCDPHEPLEVAQLRKIDLLLSQLQPLDASHTLLDIGFGWGGIVIRAAQKFGCKVKGITLSTEQLRYAQEKVKTLGLEGLVDLELIDYRLFSERCAKQGQRFHRIVSCEMIEAVGHNYLPCFFRAVEQLLEHDGVFVMQAITMPDSRYSVYLNSADFIKTMIFPGGCCPSLSALLQAMASESTLYLDHCVNYNVHYAETLRRWRLRFNANRDLVYSLGFDQAFIKLWNFYLCYCEAGFAKQVLNLQILTFSRPGNKNLLCSMRTD
eukprot:gene6271-6913_t